MKRILRDKVVDAIRRGHEKGQLAVSDEPAGLAIERPKQAEHGDWACNAALVMARAERKKPRDVAEILMQNIDDPEGYLARMDIAGPGFINFTLSDAWWRNVVRDVVRLGEKFGRRPTDHPLKIQVEFVSANPTGPLHVGHGRGAAVGDALANVLAAAGHQVEREYYVNDAGRQMQTLGRSVLYRYYELHGRAETFEEGMYQGDYIRDLAEQVRRDHGGKYLDMPESQAVAELYPWAAGRILEGIKVDLADFGVRHDIWFSERSLVENGLLQASLDDLRTRGHLYEEGGALWFKAAAFGDEKDRVLVKSSGDHTYFATDIAYHRHKYKRGFDLVINLWGADHHGYVPRMKSAIEAIGYRRDQLEILLVQLVNLLRGGEPVAMSTRAGQFVTLKEVVDDVGADVARFIFLTRGCDNSLDFDLETAKQASKDNPVYYIQYAHARISSVFKKAAEQGLETPGPDEADLSLLTQDEEKAVMKQLAAYPEVVEGAASALEPHRVATYLTELAKLFHQYYMRHRFITEDLPTSRARLCLVVAVRQVVANGLGLLGVKAPERM